jgi:hypothetical protein
MLPLPGRLLPAPAPTPQVTPRVFVRPTPHAHSTMVLPPEFIDPAPGVFGIYLTGSYFPPAGGQMKGTSDKTAIGLTLPNDGAHDKVNVDLLITNDASSPTINFTVGSLNISLSVTDLDGNPLTSFGQPLLLMVQPLADDVDAAGGDPGAVTVTQLDPAGSGDFVPVEFDVNPDGTLTIAATDLWIGPTIATIEFGGVCVRRLSCPGARFRRAN